jgi:hypothetical protein
VKITYFNAVSIIQNNAQLCINTKENYVMYTETIMRRDSSVSIATRYGLDGLGSIIGKENIFASTPQRPDRLWGPSSLLSIGYRGHFPGGVAGEA